MRFKRFFAGLLSACLIAGYALAPDAMPLKKSAVIDAEAANKTLYSDDIVKHFESKVGSSFTSNMCLAFVARTFSEMGAAFDSACCAYNYGTSHLVSASRDNIPLGADVYFSGSSILCSSCGNYAGHVGVYVGGGYIVNTSGGVVKKTLITNVEKYNPGIYYMGWGYHGNVTVVQGSSSVAINDSSFPDANFRQYVLNYVDTDQNGYLSDNERYAVENIFVPAWDISSMVGVGLFPNLKYLSCYNNNINYLDLTGNTELLELACDNNPVRELIVWNCSKLTKLHCSKCNIEATLDFSGNPGLVELLCFESKVYELKISNCPALVNIDCHGNFLTSLDVSHQSELMYFGCYENNITSLDVSKNYKLKDLYCDRNPLGSLDVSSCSALERLHCMENGLTGLDISRNAALNELWCYGNSITELDLDNNPLMNNLITDKNITIYGKTGSRAESYAKENGIKFIDRALVPTNVKAVGGNKSVTVTWNGVSGAAQYRVQRKSGSGWTTVGYPNTTSFTDKGLAENTSYTYRVLAYLGNAWGAPSVSAAAKTNGPAVTGLTGAGINNGITLKWNAVKGASKYRLQQYVNGAWATIAYPNTTSYTHTGLINGTANSYRVLAYVNGGWGAPSAGVKIRVGITVTGLTGKGIDKGVSLKWNAVNGAVKYRIQRVNASGSWETVGFSDTASYTDKNLKNGSAYAYRVLAYVGGEWRIPCDGIKVRAGA